MPAYGAPVHAVYPGDKVTMWDGTETAAEGLESVAVGRGFGPGGDVGISFFVTGLPSDAEITIECAANDVDAEYTPCGTIGPDANGNGSYTDIGRAQFYRAVLSTYASGDMPGLVATR